MSKKTLLARIFPTDEEVLKQAEANATKALDTIASGGNHKGFNDPDDLFTSSFAAPAQRAANREHEKTSAQPTKMGRGMMGPFSPDGELAEGFPIDDLSGDLPAPVVPEAVPKVQTAPETPVAPVLSESAPVITEEADMDFDYASAPYFPSQKDNSGAPSTTDSSETGAPISTTDNSGAIKPPLVADKTTTSSIYPKPGEDPLFDQIRTDISQQESPAPKKPAQTGYQQAIGNSANLVSKGSTPKKASSRRKTDEELEREVFGELPALTGASFDPATQTMVTPQSAEAPAPFIGDKLFGFTPVINVGKDGNDLWLNWLQAQVFFGDYLSYDELLDQAQLWPWRIFRTISIDGVARYQSSKPLEANLERSLLEEFWKTVVGTHGKDFYMFCPVTQHDATWLNWLQYQKHCSNRSYDELVIEAQTASWKVLKTYSINGSTAYSTSFPLEFQVSLKLKTDFLISIRRPIPSSPSTHA